MSLKYQLRYCLHVQNIHVGDSFRLYHNDTIIQDVPVTDQITLIDVNQEYINNLRIELKTSGEKIFNLLAIFLKRMSPSTGYSKQDGRKTKFRILYRVADYNEHSQYEKLGKSAEQDVFTHNEMIHQHVFSDFCYIHKQDKFCYQKYFCNVVHDFSMQGLVWGGKNITKARKNIWIDQKQQKWYTYPAVIEKPVLGQISACFYYKKHFYIKSIDKLYINSNAYIIQKSNKKFGNIKNIEIDAKDFFCHQTIQNYIDFGQFLHTCCQYINICEHRAHRHIIYQ